MCISIFSYFLLFVLARFYQGAWSDGCRSEVQTLPHFYFWKSVFNTYINCNGVMVAKLKYKEVHELSLNLSWDLKLIYFLPVNSSAHLLLKCKLS